MTQTQAVIGTAQYLSPEQARGETVDARSDLYSTGCLLFELLTGRPPFIGDSPVAVAYQHVREAAPVPSTFASDVPDAARPHHAQGPGQGARRPLLQRRRVPLRPRGRRPRRRGRRAGRRRARRRRARRDPRDRGDPAHGAARRDHADHGRPRQPRGRRPARPSPRTARRGGGGQPRPLAAAGCSSPSRVLAVAGIVALLIANANKDGRTPTTVDVPVAARHDRRPRRRRLLQGPRPRLRPRRGTVGHDPRRAGHSRPTPPEGDPGPARVGRSRSSSRPGPRAVAVPDVTGKTEQEAVDILTGAGLKVAANRQNDDNPAFPQGQVTKTDPPRVRPSTAGTAVTLFVSTGNVSMPDVDGQDDGRGEADPQRRELPGEHERRGVATRRPTPSSSRTSRRAAGQAGPDRHPRDRDGARPRRPSRTTSSA